MPPAAGIVSTSVLAFLALLSCRSEPREIVLTSTTSTEDSGLFEVLLPAFQSAHPQYRVRVIAVGSGEALRLAARGDADVVLSHSPRAEMEFINAGYGESRDRVMFNDFVVVGPVSPAGRTCDDRDVIVVLRCIAESESLFISRGDDSGTHARERELWAAAGLRPEGEWYLEVGQGMGAVLMMASEKEAVTLSDRGTYLSRSDRLQLRVVSEGDPRLRNQYSVIVVRGASNPDGAHAFVEWIVSMSAQKIIGKYGVEKYGRPLFSPNARPPGM